MKIGRISVEITRRCNLKCRHCCRGNAQGVDIEYEYIDSLLDQTENIHLLTFTGGEPSLNVPAIQYFLDRSKRKNVSIDYFVIVTNGIDIRSDFIDVSTDLYNYTKVGGNIVVSDDEFHTEQKKYDNSLLSSLHFYKKRSDIHTSRIMKEGRGEFLSDASYFASASPFYKVMHFETNYITLNAFGEIINGIDFSYNNQKYHYLCRVEQLLDFYNILNQRETMSKRMLEEDWERLPELDKMYLLEKKKEIEEEYQMWLEEQEEKKRIPAEIVMKKEKVKDDKDR